jgi:hypothetical protein
MDRQLDDLLTDLAKHLHKLAPGAQSISVSVNIYNTNRLDWNVTIQHVGEDRVGFSKNKQLLADSDR